MKRYLIGAVLAAGLMVPTAAAASACVQPVHHRPVCACHHRHHPKPHPHKPGKPGAHKPGRHTPPCVHPKPHPKPKPHKPCPPKHHHPKPPAVTPPHAPIPKPPHAVPHKPTLTPATSHVAGFRPVNHIGPAIQHPKQLAHTGVTTQTIDLGIAGGGIFALGAILVVVSWALPKKPQR